MSLRRVASTTALVLVASVSCRIYRDQPGTGEAPSEPETPAAAAEPLDDREAVAAQRPPADALNLWVLNRPTGELVASGADGSERAALERAAQERAAEQPRPTALVVLGVGEASACSAWYGRRAVDALAAGIPPLRVVASVLDSGSRWRWPDAESSVSGTIRSSAGAFGGVQAAPAASFTAQLLEAAAERQVLVDGRNPRALSSFARARPAADPGLSIPPCEAATAPGLGGPLGVLVRTAGGAFFGGVVSLDFPADAGVVSVMDEYGVALAVGPRGGVLMASDCPLLPLDRVAERVYASSNWAASTAQPSEPGRCGSGHALLTAERAWATTGSPLSWALAEMEAAPAASAPAASKAEADAGAPGPTVRP